MKVLMFGWEFPPFNSGGLGTACYGLTKSLNRNNVSLTFVLPRKIDVDVDFLKFIFGDDTLKIKTQYIFNSLLKPYSTEDSYSSSLFSDEKNFKNNIYGSNLFEEVERYGEVGGKIASMENFDIIHAHDWLTLRRQLLQKKFQESIWLFIFMLLNLTGQAGTELISMFMILRKKEWKRLMLLLL
jgi:glycogen(starch) synthase